MGFKRNIANLIITTPIGFTGNFEEIIVPVLDEKGFETGKTKLKQSKDLYNQTYSAVLGRYRTVEIYSSIYSNQEYYTFELDGLRTIEKKLPLEGTATYQGIAFTHNKQGQLTYNVDFAKKEGKGIITGLSYIGTLTLEKDKIGKRPYSMGISGNVVAESWKNEGVTGTYSLDFYGPKAEEIAGIVTLSQVYDYTNVFGARKSEENSVNVMLSQPNNTSSSSNNHFFGTLTEEISSNLREYSFLDNAGTSANSHLGEEKRLEVGFGGTRGEIQK